MYLPEIVDHCDDEVVDGSYPLNPGPMDHDCSAHELSVLEQLVCRELKNICSELATVDDDSDENLLVKARCLAYVQLLGSYPYATQNELYKSYDLELAKISYAEWSRIGIAFNILTNIPVL